YVAPDLDVWDQWNYARTEELIDSMSARYVSSAVYGVDDLDHYGNWRVVPTYGSVWVPNAAPAGWAPYSTGRWIWDRHYGWTWVDAAPWGWAPYHYAAGSPSMDCGRGRRARSWCGPRTLLRSLPSSAHQAWPLPPTRRCSAGSRSAGASPSCRGGARLASSGGRRGAAGAGRVSSTTSSSIARPSSTSRP